MALTVIQPSGLNQTATYTVGNMTVTANVTAANIKSDHLLYANGDPYVFTTNAAGSNTQVQFNDGNSFAGNSNFTFNKTTGTLATIYFSGSGNGLSNIAGANVTGAVSYATTANSVYGSNVTGAVQYATTANSVAGANVTGSVGNADTATSATTAGTVTTAAQPNITSVGTLSSVTVTGDVTGGNLVTSGTGNISTLYVGTGGANINGYTKITGNIDVTGNFNVSGNLNYQNVIDLVVGDPLIYLAANNVGDTDDIGIVGNFNNGTYQHTGVARDHTDGTWKFFTGVVQEPTTTIDWANAQYPSVKTGDLFSANITTTGWANVVGLTSNSVVNFTSASNVSLGAVGNLHITGGSNGYILTTDGAGNLSFASNPTPVATSNAVDTFIGDGSTTTFALSTTPSSINATIVNYNGSVLLRSSYSIVGSDIVFTNAPSNGSLIEVTTQVIASSSGTQGGYSTRTYTGNGVQTTYTVSSGSTTDSLIVSEDGVVQTPGTDYTVSGTTLTFTSAPADGVAIQIRELAVNLLATISITDEGNSVTTSATNIDFVGNGVSTTNDGGNVTVTIPGGVTTGKAIAMAIVFGF